ncbi:5-hydroxytryptamine receptor 3A-like [Stegastes partitus]|uniref:5-hydroxytryptamine receptor 3A-like n=1 Tax=Stegastes partitus TaxID=144197 RepID=A0A9Y4N3V0_9TELE|nr:PREDICTED: 5-hydroxytryptamine receptor 3A-like [Stegastes partitus]
MASLTALVFLPLFEFFFFPASASVSTDPTTDCSYYSLLDHLNLTGSSNIQSLMRPVKNWTTFTHVQLDILLFGILDVDEKSQTVTNHLWVSMYWTNEFLTWNASDFCGINYVSIPRSMLWIPDIVIQQDASDTGSIHNGPLLTLNSSGWVFSRALQRLTYTCQLNLLNFPFDTQHCNITFSSMSFDARTMRLGTLTDDTVLTAISNQMMITKGEWTLRNMEVVRDQSNTGNEYPSYLIYMITLERKPLLYLVNFIIPLAYLLGLDLASFFISASSGEKLSFKVTILLSISVLLLILQDMLPSTEDCLPWIASYCVAIFALVGISVLEAMLVSFLSHFGDHCGKDAQSSVDAQEDIQLEVGFRKGSAQGDSLKAASAVKTIFPVCHSEPAGDEEKSPVTPEKSSNPLDWPGVRDLLKRILDELKTARLEAGGKKNEKRQSGFCKSSNMDNVSQSAVLQ